MLAVFDLDGVLADNSHRQHLIEHGRDWDAFFDQVGLDVPLPAGRAALFEAIAQGHTPLYLSGRPERTRAATGQWLAQHGFPEAELILRPDADRRPARTFKRSELRRLHGQVALFVDDDPEVIAMANELGLPTRLADW